MAISRQFQKNWERCVDASYQVIQQQTEDKNAAAEQAFASCATEEDQMNSLYDPAINAMLMPHFKTEAKRVLIETGHLSTARWQSGGLASYLAPMLIFHNAFRDFCLLAPDQNLTDLTDMQTGTPAC
jgi:hypothetical protein